MRIYITKLFIAIIAIIIISNCSNNNLQLIQIAKNELIRERINPKEYKIITKHLNNFAIVECERIANKYLLENDKKYTNILLFIDKNNNSISDIVVIGGKDKYIKEYFPYYLKNDIAYSDNNSIELAKKALNEKGMDNKDYQYEIASNITVAKCYVLPLPDKNTARVGGVIAMYFNNNTKEIIYIDHVQ